MFFDVINKIFDFIDLIDILVTSLQIFNEWIIIVEGFLLEMNAVELAKLVHDIPTNFDRHKPLTVGHLFTIEVRHFSEIYVLN